MTSREEQPIDDDRQLDRLVDGELSEAQRRDLLSGLDRSPGGWRRCALAFLEAQSWRQALGGIAREPSKPAPPEGPGGEPPRSSRRRPVLGGIPANVLAMAACFLIALSVGWMVQDWRYSHRGGGAGAVGPVAETSGGRGGSQAGSIGPWQTFAVAVPNGPNGRGGVLQVPAREVDRLEDFPPPKPSPALPPDVLGALQRTGHEVRDNHEMLRLRLPDGRLLLVPVDQVEVHYVGKPLY